MLDAILQLKLTQDEHAAVAAYQVALRAGLSVPARLRLLSSLELLDDPEALVLVRGGV